MQKPNLQRELVNLLFKHKTLIATVFFSTVITVGIFSFVSSPVFEANSNLLIKFGREYIYQPQVGERGPSNYFQQDRILNTEIEILTSQDLLKKVIEDIGFEKLYPQLAELESEGVKAEKALVKFRENLFTQGMDKGNTLRISFQHSNPELAALTLNTLVEYFKEKRLSIYSDSNVYDFMEKQVNSYEQHLSEAKKSLDLFKQKHASYSIDEQRTLLLKQLFELNSAYKKTFSEMAETEQRQLSLQQQKSVRATHTVLFSDSGKTDEQAQRKLLELKLKEEELLGKFAEKNPLIEQTRKEIQLVRNFLAKPINKSTRTGTSEVYQNIEKAIVGAESDLRATQAKNKVLAAQRSEVEEQLQSLTSIENELSTRLRDLAVYEENYRIYRAKLEEARISAEMDRQLVSNIRVIQEASVPIKPIKPKKAINILLSLFFGAFAGIGLALIKEYLRQGISSPSGIEKKLGLPVFASIPHRQL